ncbi:phasin family protein [Ancylobacter terrae]|uniref:phasin family protein n=1 Tax=Ancylobacter sp. sgz301288 TaxID=3342077 RepID=UPI00385A16B8
MAKRPDIEVPAELRSIAEKSLDQARKAFEGFIAAAHKAVDDAEVRVDDVHENALKFGRSAVGFAEANIAASFDLAAALARASTLDEVIKLQSEFAMQQAKRLADQAKSLGQSGAAAAKGALNT